MRQKTMPAQINTKLKKIQVFFFFNPEQKKRSHRQNQLIWSQQCTEGNKHIAKVAPQNSGKHGGVLEKI